MIVTQDIQRVLTLIAEMSSAEDVRDAMITPVAEGVANHLDANAAALWPEIVAEAARNPDVAAIARDADRGRVMRIYQRLPGELFMLPADEAGEPC